MRTRLLVLALLLTPLSVSAQVTAEQLRAQIAIIEAQIRAIQQTSQAPARVCPSLGRSLYRGLSGADVVALQDFLRSEGVFREESTGFFGAITEAAVKEWQVRNGVINPTGDTSGWGIVGPRTRAAIAARCVTLPGPTSVSVTPIPTQASSQATPVSATSTASTTTSLAAGTQTTASSTATIVRANRAPYIFGIDGPDELELGMRGLFTILADDPDNERLTYRIAWGESSALDALYELAGIEPTSLDSTFYHSFSQPGYFTITATVRDPSGLTAKATKLVRVRPVDTGCTGCATTTPLFETVDDAVIQVPSGITSCATPWGGIILRDGGTVPASPYFRGSVTYTGEVPQMRCVTGRWQRCDAQGNGCVAHTGPATNPTMAGYRRYAEVVGGFGCGGYGAGLTVRTEPRTLLCASVIHQAPQGRCAYTQEETAVELFCSYNNWGERLTLQ